MLFSFATLDTGSSAKITERCYLQVQLATNQSFDLPLPASVEKDQAGAGKIINAIAQLEAEYQLKLGETNQQFADKEFRS